MDELTVNCPSCKRKFAPLPFYRSATAHVTRTCQKCGERWAITAKPTTIKQGVVHFCDFAFIGHTGQSKAAEQHRAAELNVLLREDPR